MSFGKSAALAVLALCGSVALAVTLTAPTATLAIGAAVALAAAFLLVLTRQPRRALIAALFFLAPMDISKALVAPLGQFYSPGLYVTLGEMALVALFALWLAHRVVIERRPPPLTGLDALAFAFLAVVWARSFGSAQGSLALASAVSYSLAVLAFYAASHVLAEPADLRLALKATLVVLVLETVYVALQLAARSPLPLPGSKVVLLGGTVTFGGTAEAFRPQGFLSHPNALAHHMTLLLPPALALSLLGPRRLPRRVWLGALLALALGGSLLLLTLSRGGWASFLLGASLVAVVYLKRGLLTPRQLGAAAMAAALAAIAFVAAYPQVLLRLTAPDDRSIESRVLLVDQALTIIGANPWLGVGFGSYNRAAYEYISPSFGTISEDYQQQLLQLVVHNHYLLLAAELGIPAMLFFIYLLWRWLRLPARVRQWDDPAAFALATGLAGTMLSQMLFLNSDNYYADIRVFLLWLAAGVLQAITLQAQRRGNPGMKFPGVLAALGSAMGARLGMAALNYGLFWELSHRLAPDALGGFSLLMNIFLLLQALPLLGLSVPLIRRTATEPDRLAIEVSNAFAFALPVATLMGVGVWLMGRAGYPAALHGPFFWVALAMLPTGWVIVAESTLIGLERIVDIARVQFVEALLRALFGVLAVEFGYGLDGVFIVFLVVRLCAAVVYAMHGRLPLPRAALCTLALLRRNLREVPVFLGISLMVALATRLDVIALSQLRELHDVGIYAAASRLYDAAQMIPTLTAMVMLPTLSRLFVADPARFREMLALALRICLALGFAVALAVAAFAQPVIAALYKPGMGAAAPVLRWLMFAAVFMTLDQLLSSTMLAAQAQAQDLRSLGVALAALAIGLFGLVPVFGPVGAAAAVTLALVFRVLWRLRWASTTLGLPHAGTDIARLLAAAAVGVGGLWLGLNSGSPHAALLALAGGWVGFAVAARLFGAFGVHPVQELRAGLARLTGRAA